MAGIVVGVLVAALLIYAALYRRKSAAALVDSADEIDTEANVAKKQGGGDGGGGGGGGGGNTTPAPTNSSLGPDVMLTSDGGLRVVSVRRSNPLTPLGVTSAGFIIPEAAQPEYSDAGGASAASDDASTSCRIFENQIYDQTNEDLQRAAVAAAGSEVDYDVAAAGSDDVDYDVAAAGGGGGGGGGGDGGISRKATSNVGVA